MCLCIQSRKKISLTLNEISLAAAIKQVRIEAQLYFNTQIDKIKAYASVLKVKIVLQPLLKTFSRDTKLGKLECIQDSQQTVFMMLVKPWGVTRRDFWIA
jgi:hypothetical protein